MSLASATVEKRYRSFHTQTSNQDNSRVLEAEPKEVEYEVVYFDFSCIASTPRYILSYGEARWHDRFPHDWRGGEKYNSPFGVMPLLHVKSNEGQATVAESIVIDQYLAKKFNLLGTNEYEEQTIKAFYSSIHYLRERSLMVMTWTFDDKLKEAFETWTTRVFPAWIKIQEQHLENNGSNGHFFGDKLTLADIHFVSIIDHFAELPRGAEIVSIFHASSLLWNVHETVVHNPHIAAWRKSDGFKKHVEGGKRFYSESAFSDTPAQ